MEAKELRIGNLYLNYDITSIVDADFIGRLVSIEKRGKIAIDVSPIPITAEWLERLGFVKTNGYWLYDRSKELGHRLGDFSVKEYDSTQMRIWSGACYCGIIHCQFVHQLQNLFYILTGGELTLKTESK